MGPGAVQSNRDEDQEAEQDLVSSTLPQSTRINISVYRTGKTD